VPQCSARLVASEEGAPEGQCFMDAGHFAPERHTIIWEQRLLDFHQQVQVSHTQRRQMSDKQFGDSFNGGGAGAGRNFFKPENYLSSYCMMVEVLSHRPDAPNPFKVGETRHEVKAHITVFKSPEALEAKQGDELQNVILNQGYLATDLAQSVGKIEVLKLGQQPNKNPGYKPSWVWRGVDPAVAKLVKAYYDHREEEIEKALADSDVPEYLR
jgi:hypothetical protein